MEDDFDIRTLPANFVSVSRPSKVIEKLIEKRRIAHNGVLEEMEFRKNEVNTEIECEIQNRSRILKDTLMKIKSDVEDSLFILAHKDENDIKLEDNPLEPANKEIALANDTRRKAVDEFYGQLASIDKQRTTQFKLILNETFSKLSNISYKLPFELEEFFSHEILNINQLTVNNFQNYAELQSELQLQIENDTRLWIQMLCDLKEKVKKCHEALAREMLSKSRNSLNQSLTELLKENQLAKEIQNFDMLQSELENSLDQMMSIPVVLADVEQLLDKTRNALAGLDQSAKNIVTIYKSSIVIIFNRFFEELNTIKQFLDQTGIVDGKDIEDFQKEFYAPGVEELNLKHQAEFEHLKSVWDEAISSMRNSVEETYSFLKDSAFLFDLHFQRIDDARELVKRDVKNLVQKNSVTAEISEGKLNILIDKLRQGPTERKLEKCLMDVRKALDNIQKLYISQDAAEMKAVQKFRNIVNTEVDVLMSELHRFLTVNPPDESHDPKIQRKRASQTSEIEADPEEKLIPVQMLFCKFQVEAVRNWQFGLWEAIQNYTNVGRAEIMQTAEEWIKDQYTKVNDRMTVKLAFHKPRYQRIICSVYEKRLYELERHARRFTSHKTAVDMEIKKLKELQKLNEEKYVEICNNFSDKAEEIRQKILHSGNSGQAHRYNMLYKKCIQNAVNSVEDVLCENTKLSNKLIEDLTFANMKFAKAMKFFSEGGNYTIEEVKSLMKNLNKLEKSTVKNLAVISKENSKIHMKFKGNLDAGNAEISSNIQGLIQEHEHNENTVEKIRKLQGDIRAEVIDLKRATKDLDGPFKDLVETSDKKLGEYEYVETFFYNLKQNEMQIMGQAYFLLHPEPVVMYSAANAGPQSSTIDTRHDSKDYTPLLGVKLESDECFISKLNNRLYNSFEYIQQKAQVFYMNHQEPMLDASKIQPSYDAFMQEVLEKYKKYIVQCEVSWVENVYEFLIFLNKFLQFKEQYITAFENKFYNLSHKYCSTVIENIKKQLREEKEDIKNQLHGVHSKLKALHGHPNNRHLLEEIDQEFEDLADEIEEKLEHIVEPNKETLTEEYEKVKDISCKTNDILKKLCRDDALSRLRSKLNEQFTIKLDFMKAMMECEARSEDSSGQNDLIRTISKQVLDYMNNAPPIRSKSDDALVFSIAGESYEESTSNDFLNELEDDLENHTQSIKDFVEVELVKYLEDFRMTWPNEIKTITGLFEVKYDKNKLVRD